MYTFEQYYAKDINTHEFVYGQVIHINGKCYIYDGDPFLTFSEGHLHEVDERYINVCKTDRVSGQ